MRLLKLLAYALLGYALYEFFRGMTQDVPVMQGQGGGQSGGRGESEGGQGGGSQASSGLAEMAHHQNVTGPGEGRPVQTLDPDGGSVKHVVGRGVVSR